MSESKGRSGVRVGIVVITSILAALAFCLVLGLTAYLSELKDPVLQQQVEHMRRLILCVAIVSTLLTIVLKP